MKTNITLQTIMIFLSILLVGTSGVFACTDAGGYYVYFDEIVPGTDGGADGFIDYTNAVGQNQAGEPPKQYLVLCGDEVPPGDWGYPELYEVHIRPGDVVCAPTTPDCDPWNCHPDDPADKCHSNSLGSIKAPVRDITHIASYYGEGSAVCNGGMSSFHVDKTGIYWGYGYYNKPPGYNGDVVHWDFPDPVTFDTTGTFTGVYLDTVRPNSAIPGWLDTDGWFLPSQTIDYDVINDIWWTGINGNRHDFPLGQIGTQRDLFYWDEPNNEWVKSVTQPVLDTRWDGHHDGLAIIGKVLYSAEMYSDDVLVYDITGPGTLDEANCKHYTYTNPSSLENMGAGPFGHIWATNGGHLYELGGGDLTGTHDCGNGVWDNPPEGCDTSVPGYVAGDHCGFGFVCDMDFTDGDPACVCDPAPSECGNAIFEPPVEGCDLTAGVDCALEGYTCDMDNASVDGNIDCACRPTINPGCGDGTYDSVSEVCDATELPAGATCAPDEYCDMKTTGDGDDEEVCVCNPTCGNGDFDGVEECDLSSEVNPGDEDTRCVNQYGFGYHCASDCTCVDAIYDGHFVDVPDTKTGRLETFDVKFNDTSLYTIGIDWTFEVQLPNIGSCSIVNLDPPTTVHFNVGEEKIATTLNVGTVAGGMCMVQLQAIDPKGDVHEDPNALYVVNDNMPICPSCDFKDVSAIIHPIGIYPGTKTESADDLSSAQTRVAQLTAECGGTCSNEAKSKLASANGHLRTAESYNTECQKPGDNKAICRLAQYYSEVAIELVSEGMEL